MASRFSVGGPLYFNIGCAVVCSPFWNFIGLDLTLEKVQYKGLHKFNRILVYTIS